MLKHLAFNYSFRDSTTFKERYDETRRIRMKYPTKLPIVCEKNRHQSSLPDIDMKRYLVPYDITVGQFMHIIHKRLRLNKNVALFFLTGNTMVSASSLMTDVYERFKDLDGYLYFVYATENAFGSYS